MTPARGRLFVGAVESEETMAGGRIALPVGVREQFARNQRVVSAVGAPAWCADPDCQRLHGSTEDGNLIHPTTVTVGDWVLLRSRCLQETIDPMVQCCHQDDVLAILSSV